MDWIILAIVSWVLFFLLVDWSTIKRNIWCGLAAVLLQILVDNTGISHGFYAIQNCDFLIAHSSVFFTMGPVFVVGVLISQYHPQKRIFKILCVMILATLYTLQEALLLARENVVYKNWHFADSVGVNLMAMIILNWFAMVVLNKGMKEGE